MIIGQEKKKLNIKVDDETVEQVHRFTSLGVLLNKGGTIEDKVNERIAKTGRPYNSIKCNFLCKKEIPKRKQIKTEIVNRFVKST